MRQSQSWRSILGVLLSLSTGISVESFFLNPPHQGSLIDRFAIEDRIQAIISGEEGRDLVSDVIQAAAMMTHDSCQLLGVKSVGVDYGLVRTGVAVTVGYNPKPLAILSDLNSTQVCDCVVDICKTEQASRVIVGLPLHKNGTEAEQTTLTRIFAAELAQKVLLGLGPKVPVVMWDERYTSKEAAARAHARDPNLDLYGQLDADAACIILENYYNDNGIGAENVPVPNEMLEQATQIWEEQKTREGLRLKAAQEDRDSRLSWKKEAMARDRGLESEDGSTKSKKKKKKKRGRR
jgi:putative Holliday junction resolvase